jgi:hypothetical protein
MSEHFDLDDEGYLEARNLDDGLCHFFTGSVQADFDGVDWLVMGLEAVSAGQVPDFRAGFNEQALTAEQRTVRVAGSSYDLAWFLGLVRELREVLD